MPTTVTAKAQVTIPKAIRDQVGIQPGDKVEVIAGPEGAIVRKIANHPLDADDFDRIINDIQRRQRGQNNLTTDEIMAMTRGDV